jgi:hypothetical protein
VSVLLETFRGDHKYNDPSWGPSDGVIPEGELAVVLEADRSGDYSPFYGFVAKHENGFYTFESSGCSCGVGTHVSGPYSTVEVAKTYLGESIREYLKEVK